MTKYDLCSVSRDFNGSFEGDRQWKESTIEREREREREREQIGFQLV
jgi:hypothetical protein